MPFKLEKTELDGLVVVKPAIYNDDRGFFAEMYNKRDFIEIGLDIEFVQDNHSFSKKNVLRGLHYQLNPMAQGKLVTCIRGEIFDVAVDIRKDSPTFGKWKGYILSGSNKFMFYLPPGFAHGFLVLSDEADVYYKTTNLYSPEDDAGILWNDPQISIQWMVKEPILSEKDKMLPLLKDARSNF